LRKGIYGSSEAEDEQARWRGFSARPGDIASLTIEHAAAFSNGSARSAMRISLHVQWASSFGLVASGLCLVSTSGWRVTRELSDASVASLQNPQQ
jgi:hypothetical protein